MRTSNHEVSAVGQSQQTDFRPVGVGGGLRRGHFKFGKEKSCLFLLKCSSPFQAHWGFLSGTRAFKMEKMQRKTHNNKEALLFMKLQTDQGRLRCK